MNPWRNLDAWLAARCAVCGAQRVIEVCKDQVHLSAARRAGHTALQAAAALVDPKSPFCRRDLPAR